MAKQITRYECEKCGVVWDTADDADMCCSGTCSGCKTRPSTVQGGYCTRCDLEYRITLKENHLNSARDEVTFLERDLLELKTQLAALDTKE